MTNPERNPEENIIFLTDSYKEGHAAMLPDNTEAGHAYLESRKGAKYPYTKLFGLQMILKRYMTGRRVTEDKLTEANNLLAQHFMTPTVFAKNRAMWQTIIDDYDGALPLRIRAVPEGRRIPIGNVLMTVENTGSPITAPLGNVMESLLTQTWYPSNVATISSWIKHFIWASLEKTSDNPQALPFMLHDFGFRGATCVEAAGLGGSAHLTNFRGTDTVIGLVYAMRYYGADMPGNSVAATEHQIMTALGLDREFEVVDALLRNYNEGILSVVGDSKNIENFTQVIGSTFKERIMARKGKFVVRPDSPRFIGDKPQDQVLWIVEQLAKDFGYTQNSKGYKVLDPHVGVIYGDGLSVEEILDCLRKLELSGWSGENCVYGMGGGLMQRHDRDTQRTAFKSSAQKRDGVWHDVWKQPLDATKASKRGRLMLVQGPNGYETVRAEEASGHDQLVTVFEDGVLTRDWKWDEVLKNGLID